MSTTATTPHPRPVPQTPAAPFSEVSWARTAGLREAIHGHPFLVGLADGTLPRETFTAYLAQDALYLSRYARVLTAAASRAEEPDDVVFWATSATRAVSVERLLHQAHVDDLAAVEPSPTCAAYTSWLLSLVSVGSYPELAAGALPCFRVYQEVGSRLADRVPDAVGHPYGDWISTYGAPEFAAGVQGATDLVDRLAARADERTLGRMHAAFRRGVQYEWMFWDAAHRHETWPI